MAVPLTLKTTLDRIDALASDMPSPLSFDGAVAFSRAAATPAKVPRLHAAIKALLEEQTAADLATGPLEILVGALRQCVDNGLPAPMGVNYAAELAAAEALLPADPVEE